MALLLSAPVPLEQLSRQSSTVTIEETVPTTPGGQPKRIVLVGPSLPLKGASWTGDSRIVTTWYPGNGVEATQQFLGPMEGPSEWTGVWKRTMMGRVPTLYRDETGTETQVVEPFDLWDALEGIRLAGARVRVTWAVRGRRLVGTSADGTDRPVDRTVVREGRLKSLKIDADTEVDLRWTMSFDWQSRGGRQEKASDVRRDDDLESATSAVQQSISALDFFVNTRLVSLKPNIRLSASTLTLGQIEAMANAPKKLVDGAMAKLRYNVNQFRRAGEVARKVAATPFAMANSVVDFARNTTAVANQFVGEIGRTPPELLSFRQKVSDLSRATKHFGNIQAQMRTVARQGSALDVRLRQPVVAGGNRGAVSVRESATTRAGEILSIHPCKEGDTPAKLSARYYGNPDRGDAILRANRLPLYTPTFARGQILVIPALADSPRQR